jgi:hypothetical protein
MARQPVNLPVFVTLSDVKDLKTRLQAAAGGTDVSVQNCVSIGDTDRAAWGQFYSAVLSYVREPPHFFQSISAATLLNQGEAYEDELAAWQDKLEIGGCALSTPKYDPGAQQNKQLDALVQLARWGSIALVAIGGAYGIAKLVEVLPHASQQIRVASEPRRRRRST